MYQGPGGESSALVWVGGRSVGPWVWRRKPTSSAGRPRNVTPRGYSARMEIPVPVPMPPVDTGKGTGYPYLQTAAFPAGAHMTP